MSAGQASSKQYENLKTSAGLGQVYQAQPGQLVRLVLKIYENLKPVQVLARYIRLSQVSRSGYY
jgi:hypothetical protein